ncbi:hypothetical protein M1437_02460 [Patescibacteria group bacterium]|nr:hypothetical protein [Patescibacteria group bacterium]
MTCENSSRVLELNQGTIGQPLDLRITGPKELADIGVTGMSSAFIDRTWGPGAAEKFRKACCKKNSDTETLTELAKTAGKWESRPIHPCTPTGYSGRRATDGWPISEGRIAPDILY